MYEKLFFPRGQQMLLDCLDMITKGLVILFVLLRLTEDIKTEFPGVLKE